MTKYGYDTQTIDNFQPYPPRGHGNAHHKGGESAMKVECPSCHLAGTVNELELPPEGRELTCPRCKKSFHIDRPPLDPDLRPMNVCPACQYSTFSEETFIACPKCGTYKGREIIPMEQK